MSSGVPSRPSAVVDVSPVADAENRDDQYVILDVVDDLIVADTNAALAIASCELDGALRAWFTGQGLDGALDPLLILRMDVFEGLGR